MKPLFNGEVAVVSGASRGIGFAIASRLLEAGCRVALTEIDLDATRAAVGRTGHAPERVRACRLDVRDAVQCASVVSELHAAWGPVAVLVNNAGVGGRSAVFDAEGLSQDIDDVMVVNVKGLLNLTVACTDGLRQTRGAIVNVASITSLVATSAHLAYGASKGAVGQLTKFLARDFGPHGVRGNAVAPALVMTPMTSHVADDAERYERMVRRTLLRRVGDPADIAGPVVFMASDQARYVTGTILPVDGGYTAN